MTDWTDAEIQKLYDEWLTKRHRQEWLDRDKYQDIDDWDDDLGDYYEWWEDDGLPRF